MMMRKRDGAWNRAWRAVATACALATSTGFSAGLPARADNLEAAAPTPAETRLRGDVVFLADDARDGRAPGTPGIEAAADYIAKTFKDLGLKTAPGADGYFQSFSIGEPRLGTPLELALLGPADKKVEAKPRLDFSPLAIGVGGTLDKLPVVFVGYGITAHDPSKKLDYDDYAGLDVKGKVVLMIRREPRQNDDASPFDGKRNSDFATFRHKATNAYQHGAAGVLVVNDASEAKGGEERLLGFMNAGGEANSPIPFVMIKRAVVDEMLAAAQEPSLTELEEQIDSDLKPRSRVVAGWKVAAKITVEREKIATKNVVGVLEGSGPRAQETIVVGAHYDHLGHGGMFSGSLAFLSHDIHNGADDNASGTSMVLEMARRLARRPDPLPRRVVFIAFSGEEKGLLGSQYYVEHPLYPLASTVFMVNFDMVGRLNEKNELTVYGTGSAAGLESLVDVLGASAGFTIKKIASGLGPSDQQSFYLKNLPVLFAFTGTHTDYHRPSDDADRINYRGMARIADLGELLLLDLARRPKRLEFARATPKVAAAHGGTPTGDVGRVNVTAYLGSIPDYDESTKGVKLSGVREGSPAEKGGLRGGDVVVGFGGKPVATIYDYTECLARHKPGETVDVAVMRGEKKVELKVTLGRKPNE